MGSSERCEASWLGTLCGRQSMTSDLEGAFTRGVPGQASCHPEAPTSPGWGAVQLEQGWKAEGGSSNCHLELVKEVYRITTGADVQLFAYDLHIICT